MFITFLCDNFVNFTTSFQSLLRYNEHSYVDPSSFENSLQIGGNLTTSKFALLLFTTCSIDLSFF